MNERKNPYTRWCKRCGEIYKTIFPKGKFCKSCYKPYTRKGILTARARNNGITRQDYISHSGFMRIV